MWFAHPSLSDKIREWWGIDVDGISMYKVAKKLKNIKMEIRKWKKMDFGNIFQSKEMFLVELTEVQEEIQNMGYDESRLNAKKTIMAFLHNIMGKEEMFWRQRSRSVWLKEGDKNSRLFHLSTMKHRVANRISGIKKGDDTIGEDKEIDKEEIKYFSSILSKELNLGDED